MTKTFRVRVREEYTAFVDVEAEVGASAVAEVEKQLCSGTYVVPSDLSAEMVRRCSIVRIVRKC